MCYKYSIGQPFMQPRNALSYAGNFLHMMFGVPTEEYKVNPIVERAMDRIFTLHADHEQNAPPPPCVWPAPPAPTRLPVSPRDRLPVGTGPRRCQRSLPQDARGDWLC